MWSRTGSSGGRSRSISRRGRRRTRSGRGGTTPGCRRSRSAARGDRCASIRAGPRSPRRLVEFQIVKAHDTVSRKTSGYHGGKKITGRGRHLAVDAEGWLLALVVTAASVSDKAGAKILLIKLFNAFSTLKILWADSDYDGAPLARYA